MGERVYIAANCLVPLRRVALKVFEKRIRTLRCVYNLHRLSESDEAKHAKEDENSLWVSVICTVRKADVAKTVDRLSNLKFFRTMTFPDEETLNNVEYDFRTHPRYNEYARAGSVFGNGDEEGEEQEEIYRERKDNAEPDEDEAERKVIGHKLQLGTMSGDEADESDQEDGSEHEDESDEQAEGSQTQPNVKEEGSEVDLLAVPVRFADASAPGSRCPLDGNNSETTTDSAPTRKRRRLEWGRRRSMDVSSSSDIDDEPTEIGKDHSTVSPPPKDVVYLSTNILGPWTKFLGRGDKAKPNLIPPIPTTVVAFTCLRSIRNKHSRKHIDFRTNIFGIVKSIKPLSKRLYKFHWRLELRNPNDRSDRADVYMFPKRGQRERGQREGDELEGLEVGDLIIAFDVNVRGCWKYASIQDRSVVFVAKDNVQSQVKVLETKYDRSGDENHA